MAKKLKTEEYKDVKRNKESAKSNHRNERKNKAKKRDQFFRED